MAHRGYTGWGWGELLYTPTVSHGAEGAGGAVLLDHLHLAKFRRRAPGTPLDQGHEAAAAGLSRSQGNACNESFWEQRNGNVIVQ